jgi:ADP-ribose pyrophosphatase YjhB (NUDIX family)
LLHHFSDRLALADRVNRLLAPRVARMPWTASGRYGCVMGIAPHIARLRAVVGTELLLLPAVSVLPVDEAGRLLLVRHADLHNGWGTVGGAVDPGESPAAAAVREAREEVSVDVELVRLLDVVGGPDYEVTYANGDRAAYVTAAYEARIVNGTPEPGDGEISELAWFAPDALAAASLSRFTRALLQAVGRL